MRLLTKSRFKLGLECPNKLFYTRKTEYPSTMMDDPFLLALAEGGFQTEEYARMHFPNGILVDSYGGDYQSLWEETLALLDKENVTIYEAAFLIDGLFVRTDVLVKTGNHIDLIEVKSKSYNPDDENIFLGKRGGLVSSWKPYLFDVAFQKYVISLCFPKCSIRSFIMMADKTKLASIDGLNQSFRIKKNKENRTGIEVVCKDFDQLGESVLGKKDVSDIIDDIICGKHRYNGSDTFVESVYNLRDIYQKDVYPDFPVSYTCKTCEFTATPDQEQEGLKSGYKECFKKQMNLNDAEFEKPNIFKVWSLRGENLFEAGKYFMTDLTMDNINVRPEAGKLSASERRWLQIEKVQNNDNSIYADIGGLKQEMLSWQYPLHFIDFETSAVALPFHKGQHPYEQVAFQFSHHILTEDGKIEHSDQFILTDAGVFPNFEFVRALQKALDGDQGSIFRYADHENSILNAIYSQLRGSNELDKDELMEFIRSITHSKHDSVETWQGERDMIDLLKVIKHYYYNPLTEGSNSLKFVLPAALNSSKFLKEKYSKRIGEIGVTSLNLSDDHVWLQIDDKGIINPYKTLPSLHLDWSESELESALIGLESIADGGAALTAYGKLQYTNMTDMERQDLNNGLLKYCELDTLAMVMIYEHLRFDYG